MAEAKGEDEDAVSDEEGTLAEQERKDANGECA
jgi:hypothetical protein